MTPPLAVRVLGCSGSYAGADGACTGFLVQSPGARVWLDAGPGTLANLQTHTSLADLAAIVLTHEHPDHWLELPVVYSAVRFYEPRDRLPIYGTAGTLALARTLCADLEAAFEWITISDGATFEIADQRWSCSRTEHYVETMACRVEVDDRSFVFTADTGPGWTVSKLGATTDLAIAESTFLSDGEPAGILHLSARQAGAMAAEAGVDRLVLSHLAPGESAEAHRAEAEAAFGDSVAVAAIGDHYVI